MDCTFENGFCNWSNDPNNWKLRWKTMSLYSTGFVDNTNQEIMGACLINKKKIEDQLLTARLWGPEIMKSVKLGCVSFQYRIEGDQSVKLTLMRREMG